MSFTLTQITQRLRGGDAIERTRKLAATEIIVGRGADCDIQLQDLAVSLRHARIRQVGDHELAVEALGREPFEVDGRFTTSARLVLDTKHRLGLGSYSLALSQNADAGDIRVTITREAAPPAASVEDEDRIFSIRNSVLGKRPLAWTFSLLILAVCLALPIMGFVSHGNARIHADQQWSGGPLSQAHSFLGKNCQACHQKAFVAVRDDACLACHRVGRNQAERAEVALTNRQWGGPVAAEQVREHAAHDRLLAATPMPADFGGKVQAVFRRTFDHSNDRCASCHLEHIEGKGAAALAGTVGARAIPALVSTSSCADCHGKLSERLGDTRLKDTPDWGRHPDFRPLVTASPGGSAPGPHSPDISPPGVSAPRFERIALGGRPMENNGLRFSHQIHLSVTGGVARMGEELGQMRRYGGPLDCSSCHRPDATGKGFAPVEMVRDCSSCHSLAYARIGGELQMLPHGRPAQVVDILQRFYQSGRGAGEERPRSVTRQGFMPILNAALDPFAARADASAQAANAVKTAFSPGGVCGECHTVLQPTSVASWDYRIAPVYLNDRYLPRGAFNHGVPAHYKDAHGRPTCSDCHAAKTSDSADQVLLPHVAQCGTCHGKTPAQTPLAASADCAECHSYHAPGEATPKGADREHLTPISSLDPARKPGEMSP